MNGELIAIGDAESRVVIPPDLAPTWRNNRQSCPAGYGDSELRDSVGRLVRQRTGIDSDGDRRVGVLAGGCRVGFTCTMRTCRLLRGVHTFLAFTPNWFGFRDAADIAKVRLIEQPTSEADGYLPTADLLGFALKRYPEIRGVVFNNFPTPHGPDWGLDRASELANAAEAAGLFVIEDLLTLAISPHVDRRYPTVLNSSPSLLESGSGVAFTSLSKGWGVATDANIGFIIGCESVVSTLIQDNQRSYRGVPEKSQKAARWCFTPQGMESPSKVARTVQANLRALREWCNEDRLVSLVSIPKGGTTALLDLSQLIGRRSGIDILRGEADVLFDLNYNHGLEFWPGSRFSCEHPALRINLARVEPLEFIEVLNRMTEYLNGFSE